MKKLVQDKIGRTLIVPLNDAEIETLNSRKNDQLFISIITYIIIIFICYFFWNRNNESMNLDNKSFRINFSKSETEAFKEIIPYICYGIVFVTSYFFLKFIRQTIIPLYRDIKNGIKLQIFFIPAKSPIRISGVYYLALPFLKSQQVQLSSNEYENIGHNEELCLEITPTAIHFISLHKGEKLIKYF